MVRDQMPDTLHQTDQPTINIIKYPHDVVCEYASVLDMMPKLWSGRKSVYVPDAAEDESMCVDAMILIGMHPTEKDYVFETRARRDGYEEPGEDGKHLDPDALKGGPKELSPDLNIPDIAKKVADALQVSCTVNRRTLLSLEQGEAKTKTSTDAGLYFCEFQFYTALAQLHDAKQFGRVEFFHVPLDKDNDAIKRGVSVACALAREMINGLPEDYDT
jgi:pyroglutamyl-peptidase